MSKRTSPSPDDAKLRVMLVEDHEIVREGVRSLINGQTDMQVVGEADNGRAAIRLARELLPDVVVMDISMPDMNGLRATEKMIQVCPQVKILTLTRHTDAGFLHQLLGAGASGYVLKQSASTELIRAIHAVAQGGKYLDPSITAKVISSYVERGTSPRAEPQGTMSDREEEVLRLIALGYSNKEIAARMELSVKTVEVHKSNAMKKLDITSRIDIVRYALLQGWLQDA